MGQDGNRLSIFIDGGYLFNVFTPYRKKGYRIALPRLVRRLSENHILQKVHYVDSINNRDPKIKANQEAFYAKLKDKWGWNVIVLPLQWPDGKATQKGTDTQLALQLSLAAHKNEYDTAILLTADSDFVPPVESAKEVGKIVRNAYFSARKSYHLSLACNGTAIRLDDVDFVYRNGTPLELSSLAELEKADAVATSAADQITKAVEQKAKTHGEG